MQRRWKKWKHVLTASLMLIALFSALLILVERQRTVATDFLLSFIIPALILILLWLVIEHTLRKN